MAECKHDFRCSVGVAVFDDKPGQGSVEVKGACIHCAVPLVFYGPRGAGRNYPMASVDRTELRAPVTFGYGPKFIPGPDVLISGTELQERPKH